MNNKGFAISTLIYGLSIMGIMIVAIVMGTMAGSRTNVREMNQSIEKDLLTYSGTEEVYTASPDAQNFTVKEGESGWYRIELWGAQGGPESLGAYTSGVIKLTEGESIYFYVGAKGSSSVAGESSDVRIVEGARNNPDSYNTRIMVAAGGGSGTGAVGGTIASYSSISRALGGTINNRGEFQKTGTLVGYQSGYATKDLTQSGNGVEGPVGVNGGGSGYYSSINANYGGTSYIAGYAGSGEAKTVNETISVLDESVENMADATLTEETVERSFYFLDGRMYAGVNEGDGKAKITKLVNVDDNDPSRRLPIVNKKLKGIKAVRDCLPVTDGKNNGVTVNNEAFKKIIVMKDGKEVPTSGSYDNNLKCKIYIFTNGPTSPTIIANPIDVDEIAIWHKQAGVDYYNHTIEVTSKPEDDTSWKMIKGVGNKLQAEGTKYVTNLSETETAIGFHISAYQFDSTEALPKNGNYIIMPVLDENKAISAQKTGTTDQNALEVSNINGESTQVWSIELLDDKMRKQNKITGEYFPEYKVIELARFKAMAIQLDENRLNNLISAPTGFNNYSRNDPQIWQIKPVGNGTYVIETSVSKFQSSEDTGYIYPNTNMNPAQLQIGIKNIDGQRYRLISTEYTFS